MILNTYIAINYFAIVETVRYSFIYFSYVDFHKLHVHVFVLYDSNEKAKNNNYIKNKKQHENCSLDMHNTNGTWRRGRVVNAPD